ncbi:iron permease FTR1 [Rhizoclosmatium globosum]|uniref:Iron permease FTR1 n=1 Tax=Rhizoclosmatium globosum TaxID=329046 RepID=A0A1Y2BYD3_9FUNG|nr:iron permease FTR1 [Rhizoclosmatium globosum]|eukprot:ORY39647.1 iron permease FTR1 [Rhizoclosmatium globosum]
MAIGFSFPVFFVILRECTEAAIIVSILLSYVRNNFKKEEESAIRRALNIAVWVGTGLGLFLSLAIGGVFLYILFRYTTDLWKQAEALWEAIFMLIASVVMTIMAFAFLKSDQLTSRWEKKLHAKLGKQQVTTSEAQTQETASLNGSGSSQNALTQAGRFANLKQSLVEGWKNPLFWLPFLTVIREGLEGMVFLGGSALSEPAGNIPLAVLAGLLAGALIGYIVYKAGNSMKLHTFFVSASIFLLYIAAGLISKSVGEFEIDAWNKGLGVVDSDDAGYYRIDTNVWHVNCCNPEDRSQFGWQMFSAILGWTNNATIGTITVYILFWLIIAAVLVFLKLKDRKAKAASKHDAPVEPSAVLSH